MFYSSSSFVCRYRLSWIASGSLDSWAKLMTCSSVIRFETISTGSEKVLTDFVF